MISLWLTVRDGVSCPFSWQDPANFSPQSDGRILPVGSANSCKMLRPCAVEFSRWLLKTLQTAKARDSKDALFSRSWQDMTDPTNEI